jgi:hypothetical protein
MQFSILAYHSMETAIKLTRRFYSALLVVYHRRHLLQGFSSALTHESRLIRTVRNEHKRNI